MYYTEDMQGWFVVKTHHQRERWACENILRQGAEPYAPLIAERVRYKGKLTEVKPKFLFPSYVFVKTSGQWRFLLSTYGVYSVLMQGSLPAMVLDKEIEKFKALEDSDGLVVLPPRPVTEQRKRFKKGEKLRVASGVFSGYVGVYDGYATQDRQKVLLDYLGRKVSVLVSDDCLEKLPV